MNRLMDLVRKQDLLTLALAIITGSTIYALLASFIEDIVSPLLGILFQRSGSLANEIFRVSSVRIEWGSFVTHIIETVFVGLVVYFIYKRLNKQPEDTI